MAKRSVKNKQVKLVPYTVEQVTLLNESEVPVGVEMINAPEFWNLKNKGKDVVIAVLDTGIESDHPDLKGSVIGGKNFTGEGSEDDYTDGNGHGTHVAGTIVAKGDGKGVVGVAPESSILGVKVLNSRGSGSVQSVVGGIEYAISEGVDIISMSLGIPAYVEQIHTAIKKATDNNIIVVCASGNSGDGNANTDEFSYPASHPEAISVGAIDKNKNLANFSNTNQEVDIVAHGVQVESTMIGNQYAKLSGTSMATPHITGACALIIKELKDKNGKKPSVEEVKQELYGRCVDLGLHDKAEGKGLIDLLKKDEKKEEKIDNNVEKTYSIYLKPEKDGSYSVQLGSYSQKENAIRMVETLEKDLLTIEGVNIKKFGV